MERKMTIEVIGVTSSAAWGNKCIGSAGAGYKVGEGRSSNGVSGGGKMKSTKKEFERENEDLRNIVKDLFWMARRYAHGRHTYAPSIIRDAYKYMTAAGIKINHDVTLEPPSPDEIGGMSFRSDYLDDTNVKEDSAK